VLALLAGRRSPVVIYMFPSYAECDLLELKLINPEECILLHCSISPNLVFSFDPLQCVESKAGRDNHRDENFDDIICRILGQIRAKVPEVVNAD